MKSFIPAMVMSVAAAVMWFNISTLLSCGFFALAFACGIAEATR